MINVHVHEFVKGNIVPKEKNEVLLCMKGLADYVVFKNKNLHILDENILDRYIEKMTEYDLCCMFYAFNDKANMVLDKIVNYAMEVTVANEKKEWFVRFPAFDYVVIDLRKDVPMFREELHILDFNMWLQDCVEAKLLPFNGIYFELENSHAAFSPNNSILNQENTDIKNADMKKIKDMGLVLKYDNNADDVFNYLRNKNKGA